MRLQAAIATCNGWCFSCSSRAIAKLRSEWALEWQTLQLIINEFEHSCRRQQEMSASTTQFQGRHLCDIEPNVLLGLLPSSVCRLRIDERVQNA